MADTISSGVGTFVVGAVALLVGIVTLIVAVLILRTARRVARLSEDRMEYLSEERDRLAFLREERRTSEEELGQQILRLRQEHTRLMEQLEQERAGHLETQRLQGEQQKDTPTVVRERIVADLRNASKTVWKKLGPPE